METTLHAPAGAAQRFTESRQLFRDPGAGASFELNGYVVVDFLKPAEVDVLAAAYDSLQGDLGRPAFASTIMSHNAEYRLAVSAVIARTFARAMTETFRDTRFFWGNFNVKFPNGPMGTVPLHQDPSFVDEREACPLGIWVPLVDTSRENGALEVIPGSHTLLTGPRCGGRRFPYVHLQQTLLARFGRTLPMRAGQAYVGSPALFHASPPNTGSRPRIVAAGLAGPAASGLRYFHHREQDGAAVAEMFEVDHDYYVTAPLFSRPDAGRYRIIEEISLDTPPADPEAIIQKLSHCNRP